MRSEATDPGLSFWCHNVQKSSVSYAALLVQFGDDRPDVVCIQEPPWIQVGLQRSLSTPSPLHSAFLFLLFFPLLFLLYCRHLEVVQFLHMYRTEGCTKNAMDYAAREGHMDVVEFLHQHR